MTRAFLLRLFGFAFTFLVVAHVCAQETSLSTTSPAGVWTALVKLRTTASALHVIAHPDDEDAGTLSYLSRRVGARTMTASLTRGEGGANLIAPYFFDALGVLRTLEFLKACEAYGSELYFTRAADYGYSKQLDEALRQWRGADDVLRDLVRIIRAQRPDVIFSRFRGDRGDGHGHHVLAGVLAKQAFEASADPKRYPEHFNEGLSVWRAAKVYTGNLRPQWRKEDAKHVNLSIDSGLYDPLYACSYYQIGRFGYGFHRSQGIMNHEGRAGSRVALYRRAAARVEDLKDKEGSFFDGIDVSLPGLADLVKDPGWIRPALEGIAANVERAVERFDANAPHHIAEPLSKGLQATRDVLTKLTVEKIAQRDHLEYQLARKVLEFEEAIARALGFYFDASAARDGLASSSPFSRSTSFEHACAGESFEVHLNWLNRCDLPLRVREAVLEGPDGWRSEADGAVASEMLGYNDGGKLKFRVTVPQNAAPTRPYWSRESIHHTFYTTKDPSDANEAAPAPPLWGRVVIDVHGVRVTVRRVVRLTLRSLELGTRHPPLTVAPAMSVAFSSEFGVLPFEGSRYSVQVRVRSSVKGEARGSLRLQLPDGWTATPETATFQFVREGEEDVFAFEVRPGTVNVGEYELRAIASYGGAEYSEGFRTITARDLGRMNLYAPARHRVCVADVKVAANLRVGYVMGSGDDVPRSLGYLGIVPQMLEREDLASGDLSAFNVIIVGVRAYAVREDIKTYNGRLLDYVKRGGVLLVQYQTPEFDHNFGPYPYTMRRPEEVSEEDAAVTILAPGHRVFTQPNAITQKDFEGWIEQRGSKFWRTWDERYTALLECHDMEQEPQRGGMLITDYGEGTYIYSAYAWYRQLPAGVPGAFRLYANLLSLGGGR